MRLSLGTENRVITSLNDPVIDLWEEGIIQHCGSLEVLLCECRRGGGGIVSKRSIILLKICTRKPFRSNIRREVDVLTDDFRFWRMTWFARFMFKSKMNSWQKKRPWCMNQVKNRTSPSPAVGKCSFHCIKQRWRNSIKVQVILSKNHVLSMHTRKTISIKPRMKEDILQWLSWENGLSDSCARATRTRNRKKQTLIHELGKGRANQDLGFMLRRCNKLMMPHQFSPTLFNAFLGELKKGRPWCD